MTAQENPAPVETPREPPASAFSLRDAVYRQLLLRYWMILGKFQQYAPRPLRPEHFPPTASRADLPRIALVTPSFQQAAFVERTVRSVLEQNYPHLAYAVQDGGSRDGSAELLAGYAPRLAALESAPDGGQADAIRRGFAKVSGDVMGWLNADDLLMPGALDFVGHYFATHPEVDVIYGHRVIIDAADREIGRWVLPPHDDEFLRWSDYVPQETLFWRRRVWEQTGGIDASFHFALDWDFLLRLQECGARIVRVPYFLGLFRVHAEQKTSAAFQKNGAPEISALRARSLGDAFTRAELSERVRAFRWRSVRLSLLLSLGIRR